MFRIDPFTSADLPALRRMMNDYLLEYDQHADTSQYWDDEYFAACLAEIAAGSMVIYLTRIQDGGDEPIAFAIARIEPYWYRRSMFMGTVEEFYVTPAHRRAGLGRALATHTFGELRARGASVITASVLQQNLPALLFWQHMGLTIEAYRLFRPAH